MINGIRVVEGGNNTRTACIKRRDLGEQRKAKNSGVGEGSCGEEQQAARCLKDPSCHRSKLYGPQGLDPQTIQSHARSLLSSSGDPE
jgi:hypothetical protein